jgi:regulator of sigma E protease
MNPDMVTQVPGYFWILGLLLLIGPLVTLHELGHYGAGRLFGVHADVFSFGFGPELIGITDRRGTRWRISAFPLGGYVKFAGDANAASLPAAAAATDPRSLLAKPIWQRSIVVAAGPLTNLLVAALIFTGFTYAYGRAVAPPVIEAVTKGSVAERAGLLPGDRIVTIEGRVISDFQDIRPIILLRNEQPVAMVIERKGNLLNFTVVPQTLVEKDRFGNIYKTGRLGIGQSQYEMKPQTLFQALAHSPRQIGDFVVMQVDAFKQIITGRRPISDLSGFIRMSKTAGEVLTLGWQSFLFFLASVSIAIGVINLLPIPALDGGHLLIYGIEAVSRRPLNQKLLEMAYATGFLLIICLMIFTFWNDLQAMGAWSKLARLIS